MNPLRLALLVTGMGLILLAVGIAYYQTDLRDTIPEGAAVAVILGLAGLFVMALSLEMRSDRVVREVERIDRVDRLDRSERLARPARPAPSRRLREGHEDEHYERVETVEHR